MRTSPPLTIPLLAALSATSVLVGAANDASAETTTVRLLWQREPGAETCLDGPALGERVTTRLGRNPFSDKAQRTIYGAVQRHAQRWTVHIEVTDASGGSAGSRELSSEGPDCSGLDAAATLAVALAIDPEAALRPDPAPPVEAPTVAPAPPAASVAPAVDSNARPAPVPAIVIAAPQVLPTAPPPAPLGVTATARAVVAGGLLPTLAPGIGLGVAVRPPKLAVHFASGMMWLPEKRTSDDDFAFGLTAGWIGACGDVVDRRVVSLALCGNVAAGALHAVVHATTIVPGVAGDRFWLGLSASAPIRFRLGPLTAEVGADLLVPITRSRFAVHGRTDAVFQQSPVAGTGFVGIGVSTP